MTKANWVFALCVCVLVFASGICIPLGMQQRDSVAQGVAANLTLSMDEELCYMPMDYEWFINIKDGTGKVVYSQTFNGTFTTGPTIGLVADSHYRIMVYAPTSVVVNMTLELNGDYITVDHNYIGNDFVMPSAGANLDIMLNLQNASIFTDSQTI
ncbi:MAG: hypothetical protein IJU58_04080 [Clostridia bacterium]|nr:hypothetical protein [Clostridia bacterium]